MCDLRTVDPRRWMYDILPVEAYILLPEDVELAMPKVMNGPPPPPNVKVDWQNIVRSDLPPFSREANLQH